MFLDTFVCCEERMQSKDRGVGGCASVTGAQPGGGVPWSSAGSWHRAAGLCVLMSLTLLMLRHVMGSAVLWGVVTAWSSTAAPSSKPSTAAIAMAKCGDGTPWNSRAELGVLPPRAQGWLQPWVTVGQHNPTEQKQNQSNARRQTRRKRCSEGCSHPSQEHRTRAAGGNPYRQPHSSATMLGNLRTSNPSAETLMMSWSE